MAELKYAVSSSSGQTPNALLFDRWLEETDFDFDFRTWVLNPSNSAGVTVTENTIVVSKVKPQEWFIRSNYGYTTAAERNAGFLNKIFRLSGLQALWDNGDITVVTDHPTGDTSQNYQPVGLVISPVRTSDGLMLSHAYPWDMNIPSGYWKHVYGYQYGQSWNVYGYGYDEDRALYNCNCGYDNFPEVAFAFWTGATPDAEGYVTLSSPFTISLPNHSITDPTTVEGYSAALGNIGVYNKPMTFQNVLMAHGLAFKETGTYTEPMQGQSTGDPITSHYGNEQNTAFVISTRNYSGELDHIRLPELTDLGTLIQQNFPFKFWAQLERDENHSHIWDSIKTAFRNNTITDKEFPEHLFSKSTGDLDTLTINISVDDNDYINVGNMFNGSSIADTIYFNISHGILKSLHNTFRYCTAQTIGFNKEYLITDWTGAFEGATLTNFPTNLGAGNEEYTNTRLSEPTCDIHYAADGAHLNVFGNYKDQSAQTEADKFYTMVVWPDCKGAFSRSEISEIKYILDMKFVTPEAGAIGEYDGGIFNAIFNAPDLAVAYIKNLNKGNWYLDGQSGTGIVSAGNLTEFDEDSANYLLSNVFDLRQNTSDEEHFERTTNSFNSWSTTGSCWKMPTFFNAYGDCTVSRAAATSLSGTMKIRVALNNCTLSVTDNGQTTSLASGDHTLSLAAGATTFTVTKNSGAESCLATVELTDHFRSELTRNLSSANLYLPADWGKGTDGRDIIHQSAWETASTRGWNVYVGGQLIDSSYFNE